MSTKRFLREQWDRAAGWAAVVVGAFALLLGWLGVSDSVYPAEQLPYILSGGVFGLFALGLGAVLLLSADLRDEWRKLDDIERAIREQDVATHAEPASRNGSSAPASTDGRRRPLSAH